MANGNLFVVNKQRASFLVKILYRQNSDVQGTINWLEESQTISFRSADELLALIDSTAEALPAENGETGSVYSDEALRRWKIIRD